MYLKKLILNNFKNYTEISLDFSNKINCFIGDNGEGKTNLLDAIHYLSFCKSYFNNIDSQNIQYEEDFFSIQGVYERNDDVNDSVHCILKRNQRKIFKFNKKEYERLSEHIGLIPLVMISPFDSNLIYDGSEERRKYIDGVISQFDRNYLHNLISYNKALEQRNKLLKHFAMKRSFNAASLEIWDEQLIKYGKEIFSRRNEFIKELKPIFIENYKNITGDKESVDIEYDSQLKTNDLKQLLTESLNKDNVLQYTTCGIHKDDILFKLEGKSLKKTGSQGQQKSFLIALKLAQFIYTRNVKGYKPILLFDDLFDKLDDSRVEKLINLVSGNFFGQIFITETHKDRILKIFDNAQVMSRIFDIKKGEAALLIDN